MGKILHEMYSILKRGEKETLIRPSGSTRGINMISCGEYFVLDFKQNFASDQYVKALGVQLEKSGNAYQASKGIPFIPQVIT
ncbi:MAG: hypothetical protein ACI4V1_07720 [Eubacteriales bacterium]